MKKSHEVLEALQRISISLNTIKHVSRSETIKSEAELIKEECDLIWRHTRR